jgi:phage host-nuclease inhibitor protein Gam
MPRQAIENRVTTPEARVTALEQLPARVDALASQVLQLRTEMRAEFSAVRAEIAAQSTTLRQEMAAQSTALRQEMAEQGTALRREMAEQGTAVRQEIGGLATQMRVLHEEVIGRIALLQDAWGRPVKRRQTRKP